MEKIRSRHTRCTKIIAALLVCLLVLNTSGFAQLEKNTLSPRLLFSDARSSAEIMAAVICQLIEKRAKEWEGKSIEEIYTDDMLLWGKSTEPIFEGF